MNTVTIDGLSRGACALACVLDSLTDLVNVGLITGGPVRMNSKGKNFVHRLIAAGFEFNPGEMEQIVAFIQSGEMARTLEELEEG